MRELVQKSFKAILALVDAGLSGAASRLVSLSKSDVCLFVFLGVSRPFKTSSVVYAVTLRTGVFKI